MEGDHALVNKLDGTEITSRIGADDESRGSTPPQQRRPVSSDGGTGREDADFDGALSFRVKWKVNPVVGFEA